MTTFSPSSAQAPFQVSATTILIMYQISRYWSQKRTGKAILEPYAARTYIIGEDVRMRTREKPERREMSGFIIQHLCLSSDPLLVLRPKQRIQGTCLASRGLSFLNISQPSFQPSWLKFIEKKAIVRNAH